MAQNNAINAPFPFTVVQGGTGVVTWTTPFGVLCAGTNATNPVQTLNSLGSAGQVLTSNGAGNLPSWQAGGGGGFTWQEETGTTVSMAVANGYIMNNATGVTGTLPATAAVGSIIAVTGKGAGGWVVEANTGQTIQFGDVVSTTAGQIESTDDFDCVEFICITADTAWLVRSAVGNLDLT